MSGSGLPTREDLRKVVEWLHGGQAGTWSRSYWESFIAHAYPWCVKTTRGLLLALDRIQWLERRVVELEVQLRAAREGRSIPPPMPPLPPPIPIIRRSSQPPSINAPPTPEALAMQSPVRRQLSDDEEERRRRWLAEADRMFRELSNFNPVEDSAVVIEEEETIFDPLDDP